MISLEEIPELPPQFDERSPGVRAAVARLLGTPQEVKTEPTLRLVVKPVHWSDWGRCLDERDDDKTTTDPARVTCAECRRLMAEDAEEDRARTRTRTRSSAD